MHGSRANDLNDKCGCGVVLASFGRGVLVQTGFSAHGETTLRCSLTGRKQRLVCGDRVNWSCRSSGGEAAVDSVETRRNVIERIDSRGSAEPVAANIDQLAIVVAPQPAPDWFLADRYWAGAQLKDLGALLIVNKMDLGAQDIQPELETYRNLGLTCVETASQTGAGFAGLRAALADKVTLLVGQSGVGKSSIVNVIAPKADAQTAELTRDAEGRHTTTTARRYYLDAVSAIVDAPGVRDFAPPASLARAAERGFIEVHKRSVDCRFNDCRHLGEPGCAVRKAVDAGEIAPRRYESYRRLFRLYEKLA
jgi:ribosome biogenesis GTPase / thiamine phosphate phosphatase